MSRGLTREINRRRKTVAVEGVVDEELLSVIDCMDAMANDCEPVGSHEYVAEIGRSKWRDGCFGFTHRRVYWFPPKLFAEIELAMRGEFIALVASMQKTHLTYTGFALDYGGRRLTPYSD